MLNSSKGKALVAKRSRTSEVLIFRPPEISEIDKEKANKQVFAVRNKVNNNGPSSLNANEISSSTASKLISLQRNSSKGSTKPEEVFSPTKSTEASQSKRKVELRKLNAGSLASKGQGTDSARRVGNK